MIQDDFLDQVFLDRLVFPCPKRSRDGDNGVVQHGSSLVEAQKPGTWIMPLYQKAEGSAIGEALCSWAKYLIPTCLSLPKTINGFQ